MALLKTVQSKIQFHPLIIFVAYYNDHTSIESTTMHPLNVDRAAVMPSLKAEVPDDRLLQTTHHPDSPMHMDSWQLN